MKKKIFGSMCLLAVVTVLLASLLSSWLLYDYFYNNMRQEVKQESAYLEVALDASQMDSLALLQRDPGHSRITLIDPRGKVLFDNRVDIATMTNHLNRPEVAAAFAQGEGEASRSSDTLAKQTFYHASRLANGNVLRIANTVDTVWFSLLRLSPFMLLVALVTFLLAMALAGRQTRRIVEPLNALNLEDPLNNDTYDELSPLLTRIAKQRQRIDEDMAKLAGKQKEFAAITHHMQEGLLVLNNRAEVISLNPSGAQILNLVADDCLQQHILTVNRSPELQTLVMRGLAGHSGEAVLSLGERQYELMANPVQVEGVIQGLVLLMVDVTQRQAAEQMRREFSANVSHELKTPLTSISGCAEILKNGLVKEADIPHFADLIYQETGRLICLVEDIINLSKLDEQDISLPRQAVDLLALSQAVCQRLAPVAQEKQVSLAVTGEPAIFLGVAPVLEELIYNLCDNGIKYNQPGGKVTVQVETASRGWYLTVQDTGIGIPKDQQERVFERFYRVDKSHSKETGGTGLGLSIVKHAAAYHGGTVELTSTVGVGTAIRVFLPREEPGVAAD